MVINISAILSSILLGSSLSKIIAKLLVFQKGINLFSSGSIHGIKLLDLNFALGKSYDLIEFGLFLLLTTAIFSVYHLIYRKRKFSNSVSILIGVLQFVFASIIYVSTQFASFSGTRVLATVLIWILISNLLVLLVPVKNILLKENKISLINGFFLGFYLSIVAHKLTPDIAIPLVIFLTLPIIFLYLSHKYNFLKHPAFAFLIISSLFPYNIKLLTILGLLTAALLVIPIKKMSADLIEAVYRIYPYLILFLILYNPTFYLGSFDTIEEGFWAGWLQNMLAGRIVYRDFALFHPPALSSGLYLFSNLFGASLFNLRLYFHLLQISGLIIIFLVLKNLTKAKWIIIPLYILILAYSPDLVRNNTEIRLAAGLLPILFIYWYKSTNKKFLLFLTGILSGLSLFVSVETGMASIIASVACGIILLSKGSIKTISFILLGQVFSILSVFGILYLNHSLTGFFEYIIFFVSAFSSGYQNALMERSTASTLIQWMNFDGFLKSSGFLWELSRSVIVGSLIFSLLLKLKKNFTAKTLLFFGVAAFGIILTRSALGRSDVYHISFIWILAVLLLGFLLQFLSKWSKTLSIIVLMILLIFIGRDPIQKVLFQNQLIKFQTYGNPPGTFYKYDYSRGGIMTETEVDAKRYDNLIAYVNQEVGTNDLIFVFPHAPEIYFLVNRKNATSFDSPTIFFSSKYQKQMVNELIFNKPKIILYNPKFGVSGISADILSEVNNYILSNFHQIKSINEYGIMIPN